MANYVVTQTTPIYKLNADTDKWSASGRKYLSDKVELLEGDAGKVTVNGQACRLFVSGVDAIPVTCIKLLNAPGPIPIDAVVSAWGEWSFSAWGACLAGEERRRKTRTRQIVTPALNGGLTPPLSELFIESRACAALPPPPPSSTETLYVWGGNPIGVYRDTFGQTNNLIGTIASDPTFVHPVVVGPVNDTTIYRWRQIVGGDVDTKFINGWAIEKQYAFTVLAKKPIGLK